MKGKRGGANNMNNCGNSNSNNCSGSGISGDNLNIIIIVIIVLIVLAVVVYFLYKYLNSYKASSSVDKVFIPYIHDAKESKRFSNGSIPKSTQGNEYNYNLWVYVADYSHRNEVDKCILYKGEVRDTVLDNAQNTPDNGNRMGNPSLWLLRKNNTLRVQIALETRTDDRAACDAAASNNNNNNNNNQDTLLSHTCDIEHFPLQRWVCVNLSLTNNIVDISFNGDLVKSCMLPGAPIINNSDLLVCPSGGFNGFIANLKVSDKALGSSEIKSIYEKGPTLKPGLLG